jgi:hypothetical protein
VFPFFLLMYSYTFPSSITSHHIFIEDEKMVSNEEHYTKTRVRESIKIENMNNTLNRDEGIKLNNTWKPLIK